MNLGIIVSINQRLDAEVIELVTEEFDFEVSFINAEDQVDSEDEEDEPLANLSQKKTKSGGTSGKKKAKAEAIASSRASSRARCKTGPFASSRSINLASKPGGVPPARICEGWVIGPSHVTPSAAKSTGLFQAHKVQNLRMQDTYIRIGPHAPHRSHGNREHPDQLNLAAMTAKPHDQDIRLNPLDSTGGSIRQRPDHAHRQSE